MPRARNIKPGFFDNSALGKCEDSVRILFAALWTLADREGVVEYDVSEIRRYVFGYRNVTDEQVNGYITVLSRLDNQDMLAIKKYEGREYLIIKNFSEHQNPHHTEKKGKLPPLKALISAADSSLTVTSPLLHGENPADSLIPDSLIPDSITTPPLSPSPGEERVEEVKPVAPAKAGKAKVRLDELSVDHVRDWLAKKRAEGRYLTHDEHFVLEYFVNYCKSKGKTYADYVAAYRGAFEWERCQPRNDSTGGGVKPYANGGTGTPADRRGSSTYSGGGISGDRRESSWIAEGERLAAKYAAEAERERQVAAQSGTSASVRPTAPVRQDGG